MDLEMILLGFYALGLGIPFLVVAAFLSKMGNTLLFFKQNFEVNGLATELREFVLKHHINKN